MVTGVDMSAAQPWHQGCWCSFHVASCHSWARSSYDA